MQYEDFAKALLLLWTGKSYNHPRLVEHIKQVVKPVSKHVTKDILYTTLYFVHQLSRKYETKHAGSEYAVFLAGLMIADIATHDNAYSVGSWARVSKRSRSDILTMRKEILVLIDYNLYLSQEEYQEWVIQVEVLLELDDRSKGNPYPPFGKSLAQMYIQPEVSS
jgi:hypothetical protein